MESRYYVVKKGDSLWGIAKHFGYTVDQIAARNGLNGKRKSLINIGQKIYLPGGKSGPDLLLNLRIIGLNSQPIKNAKLEIAHDGITTEARTNEDGWLLGLDIQDHTKGLKIAFENYEGKWRTIFNEKILPLGEKTLEINILTDLIKGKTLRKEGAEIVPDKAIGAAVKGQTPQPATSATPHRPLAEVPAMPVVFETRTGNGQPATVNAPLFAGENLYLNKGNEKFRQAIIDAAKRYDLTPHAFAAIINAEAAIGKNGAWMETSAGSGKARGLGQFLPSAWFQYVATPGTLGHAEALKILGASKLLAANDTLYKINGKEKDEVGASAKKTILGWRDNGFYSIDAIGAYAVYNLRYLKDHGIDATGLPPDEKVKIAYIMHHEGPGDGLLYLQGKIGENETPTQRIVARKLAKQFKTSNDDGTAKAKVLADRFNGDYVKAYYYFLANHTDSKVNAKNFMLRHEGFSERSAFEVIQSLAGISIEKPVSENVTLSKQPKLSNARKSIKNVEKEVIPNIGVGGALNWSDPLDHCSIRIGGYSDSVSNPSSARAKSLFGGRGGRHRGIDLCAVPGTSVKAVANGFVHYAGPGGSYGNVILLKVNINDLPPSQKRYAMTINGIKDDTIYFMYAHLSSIEVTHRPSPMIKAGQVIGKSGDTGNASGMTKVGILSPQRYGAHLHFEVRRSPSLKKGEGEWFDPKPFLNHCD